MSALHRSLCLHIAAGCPLTLSSTGKSVDVETTLNADDRRVLCPYNWCTSATAIDNPNTTDIQNHMHAGSCMV